jgi:hypothetical protein
MPILKKELKALLEVNDGLTDTNNKSLRYAYSKYKATIAAVQLYNQMVLEDRWPKHYQKVTVTEVRQIFVSKSVWHGQYIPCFHNITNHGEMVEWLEGSGSENDDEDVWGFKKTSYYFLDLKEWLEQKKKVKKKETKKKTEENVSKMKKAQNKIVKKKK